MKKNYYIVFLIMAVFFVISFLTNILGPIIPEIISGFKLNLTLAALFPFSFFIAYGVMSIPSGMLVDRYKEKPVMLAAFLIAFAGALLFALVPSFYIAMFSIFLIGIGMAMLQVAINPLLRTAGGEKHFAFNSVAAQLIFGSASFISPYVYSYLVTSINAGQNEKPLIGLFMQIVPEGLPWVSLYWIFAAVSLLMAVILMISRFPVVERKEDEIAGAWEIHKNLFKNKTVLLYFAGIFAYVGTEQGIANWISQFLLVYHKLDPQSAGASAVSWFWGMMTAGCLLGLLFLKFFDSRKVLIGFSLSAFFWLTAAFWGNTSLALISFPMLGFSASVMWSIIFSLALNSLDKNHGSFSGILCTAITGGAVMPVIIGWLGDIFGLKYGMFCLYLTIGYIFSIGFWSRPLINNETLKLKKTASESV